MGYYVANFHPFGSTVNISNQDGTTAGVIALNLPGGSKYIRDLDTGKTDVLIVNATNVTLFVRPGTSASVAAVAANDIPVLSGQTIIFGYSPDATHMSAIATSGVTAVGKIYFTAGKGS